MCESSDGVICDEVSVAMDSGGISAGAVAAIVIVIVILICVIGELCVVLVDYSLSSKDDIFCSCCHCTGFAVEI